MRRTGFAAVLIGFVTVSVAVGSASSAARAEQATVENVEKLIVVMKMTDLMKASIPLITEQVLRLMWQKAPSVSPADKIAVEKLFNGVMAKMPAEFAKIAVPLYRQHLTKDEVAAMLAFYTTPEGRSIIDKLPAITQQAQKLGALLGEKLAKEAFDKSRAQLRERGYKL